MSVFSTYLLLPSVSWHNPGLYPGYAKKGPISGLSLQGSNMEYME